MELEGKVAIITGGTRGIGRAIALDLATNGADVALNYRKSVDLAAELAETIRSMGRRALVVQADVSSFDDAQAMVQQVLDEFGRLDILINNAGMNWDGVVWKMTEEQWDRVIEVDLKGTFNYTRAATPIFREQGAGKIVIRTQTLKNRRARLMITDTGEGMSRETINHIFTPFFTTKAQGSGLGLSIVHSLLSACQVDLTVRSRPGAGSTFILEFATTKPEHDGHQRAAASTEKRRLSQLPEASVAVSR